MIETLTTKQVEEILARLGDDTFAGIQRTAELRVVELRSLATELLALRKRVEELEGAFGSIRWKSVDRDNMEFTARLTCWQMDAIRAALPTPKEPS